MAMGIGGCSADPSQGYSSQSTFASSVKTVAVPLFENNTYDHGVEQQLTDALIKEIEAATPYKVASRRDADSILSGRIVRVDRNLLSRDPQTGVSQELMVSLTIDFTWLDLRSDKRLAERREFTRRSLVVPTAPNSEPIELGEYAVVQEMARNIVEVMRSDW
jgi:hypothetical protein